MCKILHPNIYKHDGLNIYLNAFLHIERDFYKKADNFIEGGLIVVRIFMDALEIKEFFGSGVINDSRSAYQIYI